MSDADLVPDELADDVDATPAGQAAEADGKKRKKKANPLREWAVVVVVAIAAAMLIRVYVLQQFYIDGSSMMQTLHPEDRVLINKLSYRLHDPNRGDVVVLKRPGSEARGMEEDLIKRVIALPGEKIEIRDCDVYIDGRKLVEPYLDPDDVAQTDPALRCGQADRPTETVPEGTVFVMGDNRPASGDSRMFGPISRDLILGRAFVVIWPLGDWQWL